MGGEEMKWEDAKALYDKAEAGNELIIEAIIQAAEEEIATNEKAYLWEREQKELANKEITRLREALESIAANTCCGDCQEAKRVAIKALKENSDDVHN